MSALGGCLLGAALWLQRVGRAEAIRAVAAVEVQNPMSLLPALKLGAILTVVLVLAAVGHDWLGDRGVIGAAALAGLADVDAIVLAVGRSVSSGQMPSAAALLAVIVAAGSNTIVKTVIAWWSGGRRFASYLAVSSGVALAAALGIAALAWRRSVSRFEKREHTCSSGGHHRIGWECGSTLRLLPPGPCLPPSRLEGNPELVSKALLARRTGTRASTGRRPSRRFPSSMEWRETVAQAGVATWTGALSADRLAQKTLSRAAQVVHRASL